MKKSISDKPISDFVPNPFSDPFSGITKFDLMGEYSKLDWLGNFHLVLFYNLVFEASTSLCLTSKFTSTVRRALLEQMRQSAVFTRLMTLKFKTQ